MQGILKKKRDSSKYWLSDYIIGLQYFVYAGGKCIRSVFCYLSHLTAIKQYQYYSFSWSIKIFTDLKKGLFSPLCIQARRRPIGVFDLIETQWPSMGPEPFQGVCPATGFLSCLREKTSTGTWNNILLVSGMQEILHIWRSIFTGLV